MQKVVDAEDCLHELTSKVSGCLVGGPEYTRLMTSIEKAKKDLAIKKFETRETQVHNGIEWDPLGPEGFILQVAGSGDLKVTEELIAMLEPMPDPAIQKALQRLRRAHLIGNKATLSETAKNISTAIHPELGIEAAAASSLYLEHVGFEQEKRRLECVCCGRAKDNDTALMHPCMDEQMLRVKITKMQAEVDEKDNLITELRKQLEDMTSLEQADAIKMSQEELRRCVVTRFEDALDAIESAEVAVLALARRSADLKAQPRQAKAEKAAKRATSTRVAFNDADK